MINKLSIVIPAYNEAPRIGIMLEHLKAVKFPVETEIIVVNDGSKDKTKEVVKKFKNIKYFEHPVNMGKGAAIKTAISHATGEYIVIQDADLEYNPKDILRLLAEANLGKAKIVYGSRLTQPPTLFGKNRTPLLAHYIGNKILSLLTSILYSAWITDMETGYKFFPRDALKGKPLNSRRFELEPELTAKFLKAGYKIKEIPISTKPRGWEEGKHLNTVTDGFKALFTLIRYRFTD